ncbi:MAG: hypothetical protein K1X94_04670 [Sandaracinaceae bacterium]|nr:hypothetical protein [Sandaracinaceae bacterium]
MSSDPNAPQPGWAPLAPTPPSGPGPSLEEEERAMRSGRGRMIAFGGAILLALIVGGGYFLMNSGPNPYSAIGRQVNGMRSQNFDSFWACALPRTDPSDIHNNEQLQGEIHERATFSAAQYAQLVRTTCLANLNDHVQPLDSLLPTDDLRPSVEALRAALRALIDGWNAYLTYLQGLTAAYDRESEDATRLVQAIARAWFDYKLAFGQINDIVREHVTE